MNIYQRINAVRKAVAYVQKDKYVEGKGYKAVTHDAVTGILREHLIEQGVVIEPTLESASVTQTGTTTAKGIPIIRLETIYLIGFVNEEKPEDRITLRVLAHALDEGDKAPGKALSYATKYAMLKIASLETGEDDEDRQKAQVERRIAREKGQITPAAGTLESLAPDVQTVCMDTSREVQEAFDHGKVNLAMEILDEATQKPWATTEAKIAIWHGLDSKCRAAIKKQRKQAGESV